MIVLMADSVSTDVQGTVDSVLTISEAIHQYGPLVVLMSIFFIIFIILIIVLLRSNSKLMDQLIHRQEDADKMDNDMISKFVENALEAQNSKHNNAVQNILDEFRQTLKPIENAMDDENRKEEYHKDLVGAYIDVNMAFKNASRDVLNKLKCNRIAIYVFHNGNESIHGLPFFKMSCVHEWTDRGTNTLRGKFHSDIPLHLFSDFIEDLYNTGYYKASDIDKVAEIDPSIKHFVQYSDTKSLYMVAVKDTNGSISGFITAEFDDTDIFDMDEDRNAYVKAVLDEMALKIQPIISTKYTYKNKTK